jgi:hypothetical protein
MVLSTLIILAAGLGGIVLLWIGLRGRAIDGHPVCRKCGYDLTGLFPEGKKCPECGADLTGGHNVRIGNRAKRPVFIGTAVVLFLASATMSWLHISEFDWTAHKPVSWLLADSRGDAKAADAAIEELLRRLALSSLDSNDADRVADHALAIQRDQAAPWNPRWGGFIRIAYERGLISEDRFNSLFEQSFQLSFVARPDIRVGDPVVIGLTSTPIRVGYVTVDCYIDEWNNIAVNGEVLADGDYRIVSGRTLFNGETIEDVRPIELDDLPAFRLPFGVHRVDATIGLTVWRQGRGWGHSWSQDVSGQLTIVDNTSLGVARVVDPAKRDAVRSMLEVNYINFSEDRRRLEVDWGTTRRYVSGVPLHLLLAIRKDGQLWDVEQPGSEIVVPGAPGRAVYFGISGGSSPFRCIDPSATTLDVVFIPSSYTALRTLDVTEIWGEEIVFKDVPINLSPRGSYP